MSGDEPATINVALFVKARLPELARLGAVVRDHPTADRRLYRRRAGSVAQATALQRLATSKSTLLRRKLRQWRRRGRSRLDVVSRRRSRRDRAIRSVGKIMVRSSAAPGPGQTRRRLTRIRLLQPSASYNLRRLAQRTARLPSVADAGACAPWAVTRGKGFLVNATIATASRVQKRLHRSLRTVRVGCVVTDVTYAWCVVSVACASAESEAACLARLGVAAVADVRSDRWSHFFVGGALQRRALARRRGPLGTFGLILATDGNAGDSTADIRALLAGVVAEVGDVVVSQQTASTMLFEVIGRGDRVRTVANAAAHLCTSPEKDTSAGVSAELEVLPICDASARDDTPSGIATTLVSVSPVSGGTVSEETRRQAFCMGRRVFGKLAMKAGLVLGVEERAALRDQLLLPRHAAPASATAAPVASLRIVERKGAPFVFRYGREVELVPAPGADGGDALPPPKGWLERLCRCAPF
jgi:hypothetical protein